MHLEGTPSDKLPDVLATGATDASLVFLSLSSRDILPGIRSIIALSNTGWRVCAIR
jgi:hypothetical protein